MLRKMWHHKIDTVCSSLGILPTYGNLRHMPHLTQSLAHLTGINRGKNPQMDGIVTHSAHTELKEPPPLILTPPPRFNRENLSPPKGGEVHLFCLLSIWFYSDIVQVLLLSSNLKSLLTPGDTGFKSLQIKALDREKQTS